MQRGRATATRGHGAAPASRRGRPAVSGGNRRSGNADPVALAAEGAEPTVDELLELQRDAGNHAVTVLLATFAPVQREVAEPQLASEAPAATPAAKPPSDINLGFNALDTAHRLIESIDQSQVKYLLMQERARGEYPVRHIDFPVVSRLLSGLTADQVKEVEARYLEYEKSPLQVDLFGRGESGHWSDLTAPQTYQLKALLAGTRASSEQDAGAAAENQRAADVAEVRGLLKGSLGAVEIERVMALLRRPKDEAELFLNAYEANYELDKDLARLPFRQSMRARELLEGSTMAADARVIENNRYRIMAIDQELKALRPPESMAIRTLVVLSDSVSPLAEMQRKQRTDALQAERKTLVQGIEDRLGEVAADAKRQAEAEGKDAFDLDAAVRASVGEALGPKGEVEEAVGGTSGKLIAAIARNEPSERVAAELRKLEEDGKLTTEVMAQTLRGLRAEADEEAERRYPSSSAEELREQKRKLADEWFIHLRSTWDASVVGEGRTFDQLLDKGDQTEVDVKRGLYMGSGELKPVDELVLALAGERKDLDTVKRVLRDKNAQQIANLKVEYASKTVSLPYFPKGRSLDKDLFGDAPTKAGEENPRYGEDRYLKAQGKATGTDRLLLEDYVQRPTEEGGVQEADYVLGRAEREYEYTIENRGATGWWRDHWGNEAKSLLDATIGEVRRLRREYLFLTAGGMNPGAVHLPRAHEILHEMHLARATIRGDRAAYEKAIAELRATLQTVASFVLQAVLTAVLTPAATALFRGAIAAVKIAQLAKLAAWTRNTAVGIAATIAANKTVYGPDYTSDMLLHDLKGGLGSAIGASGVERLLGPVAQGITARLGKPITNELMSAAKTAGGMEATAALEGEDAHIFENFLQNHVMGKVGEGIGHLTTGVVYGHEPTTGRTRTTAGAGGAGESVEPTRAADGDSAVPEADVPEPEQYTPMALPEPAPPAGRARETARPKGGHAPEEAGSKPAAVEQPAPERPVADAEAQARETADQAEDFLDADASDQGPADAGATMVGMGAAGPAGPDAAPRGHYSKAGEQAEQARRAERFPKHGRLIERTARPDARARRRAAEFSSLDAEWHTLEPPGRLKRIGEILNAHLRAVGVPEVEVGVPDLAAGEAPLAPGNAKFDRASWKVSLSEETIAKAALSPDAFALLVSNAVHEGRHALHHYRGIRAAMMEKTFGGAVRIPDRIRDSARVANANAAVGTELDTHFARGTPAYGEALSIYDQTYGAGAERRAEVLAAKGAAKKEVTRRDREHRRAVRSGDPARIAEAARLLRDARTKSQQAHNEYVALPQEIDAWRYGKATQKATAERVRVERGIRKLQARVGAAELSYREAARRYRAVKTSGGDTHAAYAEFRAEQMRWLAAQRKVRALERRLADLEPPPAA